ncbi:MAGUK p55 subfamily member 4, partial [Bienertia sinuspersici]
MDTSWIDLRNDDPAFYEGCKAFVEIAKETSIEGNTRCPCNKCKLNKWFPLEEEDAKAKTDILAETDGSKSRKEVENEVFESLMYGGEPPKRPRGFGFGVVKSNIYGVHGLLRREGRGKVHKRPLDNENVKLTMSENAELVKRNEVLEERLNQNTMLLMSLLEGMRNGKPSTELIDAAQTSLRIANPK